MDTRPGSAAYNPPPAFTNNTPTVDPGVRSQTDLINVSTVLLVPPVLKLWVDSTTNTLQAWTLQADALGLLPADYNAVSNVKSWHQNPAVQFVAGGVTSPVAGQFFFSNSNGVSFGLSGSTMTASIVGGAAGGAALSAGTQLASSGTVVFSNSNGITFGMSNSSVLTASFSAPPAQTAYVFSNSNNVTFGTNGSTLTASASFPAATAFVLSNSNGVSFGTNGSTVTASVAAQTSVVFSNSNNVSFGVNAGTLTASASVASSQGSITVSGGASSAALSALTFSNSNGVSFGLSTGAGVGTMTASHALNVSANGGTSNALSAITFSNSNNVSFGLLTGAGVGTMTASIATSLTNVFVSAGASSLSLSAITFSNSNNVSFGLSGNSVMTASVTVASTQGSVKMSAGASSASMSAVTFSNSNNVSFGFSTGAGVGTMTGSYALNVSAGGGTSNALSALTFANSNGVTFGLSTGAGVGTMTASHAINVSAGSTSNNLSAITFSNSNGISFGLNGSVVTAAGASLSNFEAPAAMISQAGAVDVASANLMYFSPFVAPMGVSFSRINQFGTVTMFGASSAVGTSGQQGFTQGFALYSRSATGVAGSTNIVSFFTTSATYSGAWSCSATSISMTYGWQTGSTNGSSSISFSGQTTGLTNANFAGVANLSLGGTGTFGAGEYWMAYSASSSSAGGASASSIMRFSLGMFAFPASTVYLPGYGQAPGQSSPLVGVGVYSATSAAFPATVALSAVVLSGNGNQSRIYANFQA